MVEASGNAGMAPARVPGPACRINALPDDILHRALSHMEALQVVQTGLLSRWWCGLWRATRREFHGMADTGTARERDVLFKAFVNRFLMLRNPVALDELRLVYRIADGSVDLNADSEDANLWIHHALQSKLVLSSLKAW